MPSKGGSSLTQQLAKNAFFKSERSVVRKVRELVTALLESRSLAVEAIGKMFGTFCLSYDARKCRRVVVSTSAKSRAIFPTLKRLC